MSELAIDPKGREEAIGMARRCFEYGPWPQFDEEIAVFVDRILEAYLAAAARPTPDAAAMERSFEATLAEYDDFLCEYYGTRFPIEGNVRDWEKNHPDEMAKFRDLQARKADVEQRLLDLYRKAVSR